MTGGIIRNCQKLKAEKANEESANEAIADLQETTMTVEMTYSVIDGYDL